ncbi:hypothetical protein [Haloglycomyces albus]|uniref:hypothetical protein n=1 Tax=Haloglycomyces albus TaxID=526067 RepID=UPI0012EB2E7B|nr:hypothetical protein [Haloglycomyces albus]
MREYQTQVIAGAGRLNLHPPSEQLRQLTMLVRLHAGLPPLWWQRYRRCKGCGAPWKSSLGCPLLAEEKITFWRTATAVEAMSACRRELLEPNDVTVLQQKQFRDDLLDTAATANVDHLPETSTQSVELGDDDTRPLPVVNHATLA